MEKLQEALAGSKFVITETGMEFQVPHGTYKLTNITIPAGITIRAVDPFEMEITNCDFTLVEDNS